MSKEIKFKKESNEIIIVMNHEFYSRNISRKGRTILT